MFLQLLLFGGHGTGGWLSRYDIYHNDCVVLDRGECFSEKILGDLVIVDDLFAYAMAAMVFPVVELSTFNFSCDACVTLLLI